MKNKIFLSSMLIMSVAPAMAEDFPTNGLMQENTTYTNAATETNMAGVYEGSVNATAEYETINYLLNAGQYLPADSETITTCPAGSFCSGIGNVNYNQTTPQGIQTCPSGFSSSALGSSSNTQCYRACDINNVGDSITAIAHATGVKGNDYYGNGTDTCEPTGCDNGYHKNAADVVAKTPIVPFDYNDAGLGYEYINANGVFGDDGDGISDLSLTDNNTWAIQFEEGTVYGRASCKSNASSIAVYSQQAGIDLINGNTTPEQIVQNIAQIAGQEEALWVANIFEQIIQGTITSTEGFSKLIIKYLKEPDFQYISNSSGQYCYCQTQGYRLNNEQMQNVSGASWYYWVPYSDEVTCASQCAFSCAYSSVGNDDISIVSRAKLFDAFDKVNASCEANTITINWSNADAADISANNAGTATYGSDVRTPVKAQTIKGKTFKGWRFSKPEQTTTGN